MRSVLALLAISGLALASKVTTHRHAGVAHHHHGENSHAHRHSVAHKHAVARRHRHGEDVHRPVRKSLLRFPLRKVAARRRVIAGESTRKTVGLFKLPSWLSRRAHHHHGEHTHKTHKHHAHGEHTHKHGKALVKRVRSALGLFKLPSFAKHHHAHGEHTHAARPLLKRITKRVARIGEEVVKKEQSLFKRIKSAFGLFKLPSWLKRRTHRHAGEHTHKHRHGEHVHRVLRKPVKKSLALFKKSVRVANKKAALARAGEGEEVVRKTNKKALDRKALRKARKAAEKRRRLHKRANKKVARAGEGEEVVKRVAKKAVKKNVKALGLFELSNLLNLNQF